jgi:hypothetical protein
MKWPMKMVMHTERIIHDADYFDGWLRAMGTTDIPESVLDEIRRTGRGSWESVSSHHGTVKTTYELVPK